MPRSQGEGVPVRVVSAGICGSDLHFVSGAYTPTGTLGHEVAGLLPDGRPVAIPAATARAAFGATTTCARRALRS